MNHRDRSTRRLFFLWTRALLTSAAVLIFVATRPVSTVVGQAILQAAGGTWNFSAGDPPGTALLYTWRTESDQAEPLIFTLLGPSGWNNGAPLSWQIRPRGAGPETTWKQLPEIPAVAGRYALSSVIGGKQAEASFSIALSTQLDRPSVTVRVEGLIRLSWSAVPNTLSYLVYVVDPQDQVVAAFGYPSSRTNANLAVPLRPGRYRVKVSAYTFDFKIPLKVDPFPERFDGSEGVREFDSP